MEGEQEKVNKQLQYRSFIETIIFQTLRWRTETWNEKHHNIFKNDLTLRLHVYVLLISRDCFTYLGCAQKRTPWKIIVST